jgi:putative membrane protein
MIPLLIRLAINAVALAVAAWLLPGIQFGPGDNNFVALIVVALIFGLLNAIVKPILALLTCPLYILTLGLFTFVMNALILLLTSWIAERIGFDFSVDGFVTALIGAIIISIVSFVLSLLIPDSLEFGKNR